MKNEREVIPKLWPYMPRAIPHDLIDKLWSSERFQTMLDHEILLWGGDCEL